MGKIKLNKDGIKGIFINHVEKMVLGMVLLVFCVFVYSSLGLEGLPSEQTPDALIKSAQSAEKNILNPENSKEVLASVTVSSGYLKRANDKAIPTNAQLYASLKPISPSYPQEGSKRQDPKLLPPEKVEVYAITGPVAVWMKNIEEDALAKEKNSVATPKAEPVKKKKKKAGEMEGYGYSPTAEEGTDSPAAMGMAGGMMPGMGMPGSDPTAGATGGTLASPQDRSGFIAGQGAIAKSRSCVAVKAILPWKAQWEVYDQTFSTALGFNPVRDTPRYVSFTAERLEVSDDPTAPMDWSKAEKVAFTSKTYTEVIAAGYAGFAQEIADPRYLQFGLPNSPAPFGLLTFPVPPFINRNLEPLALHSDVPKMSPSMKARPTGDVGKDGKKKEDKNKKAAEVSDEPSDAPGAAPSGATPGGPGYPGGMSPGGMAPGGMMPGGMGPGGMMPGGFPGGGMPPGGMPGMGEAGSSGMMSGMMGGMMPGMPGMGQGGEVSASYGDGGMMGGYPGMGGYGDQSMGGMSRGPIVPYLLIRFFDFSVEPGKKYRYRVQTILEDPNHPQFAQLEPSDRYLDDPVKKRLGQVAVEEKNSKTKARKYFLRTDWSQPSDPVSVEVKPQALAGHVSPLKSVAAPEKNQQLVIDEPQAKIMSVIWDAVHATEVTGITDTFRGTYLNFKANGNAIHPVMLLFKSLENYDFRTEQLVADIRGGEELAGREKEQALYSPGQYALIDDSGQIIVRNEFDDWDNFRKLTLPELPEPAGASMYPGGGTGMEEMTGGKGYPGGMMPGMNGPSGTKKGRGTRPTPGSGS